MSVLREVSVIDFIGVLESGHIEVRRAAKILRDDEEVARTFHRHVLAPGDDTEGQDPRVIAIASVVWTAEVLEQYRAEELKRLLLVKGVGDA